MSKQPPKTACVTLKGQPRYVRLAGIDGLVRVTKTFSGRHTAVELRLVSEVEHKRLTRPA
jgi:hypothetical protein